MLPSTLILCREMSLLMNQASSSIKSFYLQSPFCVNTDSISLYNEEGHCADRYLVITYFKVLLNDNLVSPKTPAIRNVLFAVCLSGLLNEFDFANSYSVGGSKLHMSLGYKISKSLYKCSNKYKGIYVTLTKSIKTGVIRYSQSNSTIYFAHICTTASLQNISDMFCYSAIVFSYLMK